VILSKDVRRIGSGMMAEMARALMDAQGLKREDVKLDFRDQVLTVYGQRPAEGCCPERYQQLERGQGGFSRSFRFGLAIAADRITADLADGVLTITIPKTTPTRREIDIA